MYIPPPFVRPQPETEPAALVRVVTPEEIYWNRPLFKAPPLVVEPPLADVRSIFAEAPRVERRANR